VPVAELSIGLLLQAAIEIAAGQFDKNTNFADVFVMCRNGRYMRRGISQAGGLLRCLTLNGLDMVKR